MVIKKLQRVGIICIVLLLMAACGNDANNDNQNAANEQNQTNDVAGETVDPAIAQKAETVFKNRCIQCHGSELQGLMGDQSNLQTVGARLTREEIEHTIRNGVGRMPALGNSLDDDEIEALAEWLVAKK